MHPADITDHQARRRHQALNALERDGSRLAARLPRTDARVLRRLLDAAHDGTLPIPDTHALIRRRISQLDKDSVDQQTRAA